MNKSKPTKQEKHTHLEICTCYEPQQDVKAYVNSRKPETKGEARSIAGAYHARKAEEKCECHCHDCEYGATCLVLTKCQHCQPKAETGWADMSDEIKKEILEQAADESNKVMQIEMILFKHKRGNTLDIAMKILEWSNNELERQRAEIGIEMIVRVNCSIPDGYCEKHKTHDLFEYAHELQAIQEEKDE